MHVDGQRCELDYVLDGQVMTIVHTAVPSVVAGRGLAGELAQAAMDAARTAGWKVVSACSYIAAWLRRHPGYADLLA
ncbi:GNAT family N-acetyltransferase [Dyella sp. A6]|uniref:GNAT family N-acetyltransferase n=1 Tax=Dyella aluminiiresistens TaxID=3069105 RepID=UPI002E78EC1D|nr:GNAT family N-acetyltransferase [Dyella sp. A6]